MLEDLHIKTDMSIKKIYRPEDSNNISTFLIISFLLHLLFLLLLPQWTQQIDKQGYISEPVVIEIPEYYPPPVPPKEIIETSKDMKSLKSKAKSVPKIPKKLSDRVLEAEKETSPKPSQVSPSIAKIIPQPEQTAPEPEPAPKPISEPEPASTPKHEPEPEPKPEHQPKIKSAPKLEPAPEPEPAPKPESKPKPEPKPTIKEDVLAKEKTPEKPQGLVESIPKEVIKEHDRGVVTTANDKLKPKEIISKTEKPLEQKERPPQETTAPTIKLEVPEKKPVQKDSNVASVKESEKVHIPEPLPKPLLQPIPEPVPEKKEGKGPEKFLPREKLFPSSERLAELDKEYQQTGVPGIEEGKTLSLNTSEFRYYSYLMGVKRKIELVWNYPYAAARAGQQGKLELSFTIKKDGTVEGIKLKRGSGYAMLDDEAISAIRLAAPFKEFPKSFNLERFTIDATFEYIIQPFFFRKDDG